MWVWVWVVSPSELIVVEVMVARRRDRLPRLARARVQLVQASRVIVIELLPVVAAANNILVPSTTD